MQDNLPNIKAMSKNIDSPFFLIGLLNEFVNNFQVTADAVFHDITWKQSFAMISLGLFKEPPTIKEVAEVIGSSHQNVKQILLKLEKTGYVELISDQTDKRKIRVALTTKAREYMTQMDTSSRKMVDCLFEDIDPKELQATVKVMVQLDQKLKEMKKTL